MGGFLDLFPPDIMSTPFGFLPFGWDGGFSGCPSKPRWGLVLERLTVQDVMYLVLFGVANVGKIDCSFSVFRYFAIYLDVKHSSV